VESLWNRGTWPRPKSVFQAALNVAKLPLPSECPAKTKDRLMRTNVNNSFEQLPGLSKHWLTTVSLLFWFVANAAHLIKWKLRKFWATLGWKLSQRDRLVPPNVSRDVRNSHLEDLHGIRHALWLWGVFVLIFRARVVLAREIYNGK